MCIELTHSSPLSLDPAVPSALDIVRNQDYSAKNISTLIFYCSNVLFFLKYMINQCSSFSKYRLGEKPARNLNINQASARPKIIVFVFIPFGGKNYFELF